MSHADKATRAKAGFGGSENGAKGGHAKRVPRLSEVLAEKIEARADEIIDRLFSKLDAERAVVVGTGPKARLELAPDEALQLQAIREILDRHLGRPKTTSESKVEVTSKSQMDREIERLSEEMAHRANGAEPARS